VTTASIVPATPRISCPPPRQSPITVVAQSVAAVVTPVTRSPRLRIVPPPMKPTPVRMPRGMRMRSMTPKEPGVLPPIESRILAWIIAIDAAKPTKIVVLRPAACPCAPRSRPIAADAIIVSRSRIAISCQVGCSGMLFKPDSARSEKSTCDKSSCNKSAKVSR